MNYIFLSVWILLASMHTGLQANPTKESEQPQVAPSGLKIGYVDVAHVFDQLPEAKKNSEAFQTFQSQFDNQLQIKMNELQEKHSAYQKEANTLTEVQQKQKEAEINALLTSFRKLEEQRPAKIAEKYNAIIKPIHDKIQEVIKKIAAEHNYAFVLNKHTEAGPIVFFAQPAFDLSELVLEKLKAMAPKEIEPPVVGPKRQAPAQPSTRSAKSVKKQ